MCVHVCVKERERERERERVSVFTEAHMPGCGIQLRQEISIEFDLLSLLVIKHQYPPFNTACIWFVFRCSGPVKPQVYVSGANS